MARCPRCGAEATSPTKIWPIPFRNPMKQGEEPKLAGIFECPGCRARFRAAVEPVAGIGGGANIKNMVERIRGIRGELVQTLKNLNEKIRTLETERTNLMVEIEKLRKVAESRANALESEVSMLREEVNSLRTLLGYGEESEEYQGNV